MRNLINLLQTLEEAAAKKVSGSKGLDATNLTKSGNENRLAAFLDKLGRRDPFTLLTGPDEDQAEVTLDSRELPKVQQMIDNGAFTGGKIKLRTTGGDIITIDMLAKTNEFGGQAAKFGQSAGKEGLLVKPSQIKITNRDIPANQLYDEIANNPILNSTDYGKVIIQLAGHIFSREFVMLPDEYQTAENKKLRAAIVDYAGEYLGVLALMIPGASRFPRRAAFEEWLGGNIGDTVLFFPAGANNQLADSEATITNPNTSHTLNISSKGTGGGAAPAISGLKVPEDVATDPNFSVAVEFIRMCQDMGTIAQAFAALDLVFQSNPKAVAKKWHKFLPFATKNPTLNLRAKQSIDKDSPLPQQYSALFSDIASEKATDGGKLVYAIKKEVASAINDRGAIPEFRVAVLQILEMNFIQQYADYKGGELKFETQWPAKLHGDISVINKSSATEPTAGGFSFKLGRVTEADEPGPDGDVPDEEVQLSEPESERDLAAGAEEVTRGHRITLNKDTDKPKGPHTMAMRKR